MQVATFRECEKLSQAATEPIMTQTRRIRLGNRGLHARPASTISRLVQTSSCSVKCTYRQETVDAKSVLSLLSLGAPPNSWITFAVVGPHANTIIDAIEDAFHQGFGDQEW